MLIEVTKARASATSVQLSAEDLDDPAKVRAFNDAQSRLRRRSSRCWRRSEAYPDLKSNQNFLTLQSQIEGTENSILVARRDYNEAVQAYNTRIRTFPDAIGAKIFYGAKPKVPFEAAAGRAGSAQGRLQHRGLKVIRFFVGPLWLAVLAAAATPAYAQTFPKLTGRVVDQADLLTPGSR